jgi:hypothetical protein
MPNNDARDYIRDNFRPEDRLAVVLVNKQNNEVVQRIATAEKIAGDEFQAWLRYMNAHDSEVLISMNSLHEDARGRTKADVAEIRHVYLDLDDGGPEALKAVLDRQDLPKPNYVLNTSPGKFQIVWKAEGFTKDQAEDLQKTLVRETGADPAATDCARVLRVPGFYNHKYETPHYIRAEKHSSQTATPAQFPAREKESSHAAPSSAGHPASGVRHSSSGKLSQSERDWAYAKRSLARGVSKEQIIKDIIRFRPDKPNPRYYAEHTVNKAAVEFERHPGVSGPESGPDR